jgi:hypothetical protein
VTIRISTAIICLICLQLLANPIATAQTENQQFQLLYEIPIQNAGLFATDKLGNLYTVHQGEIRKHDSQGAVLFRFNDMLLGPPSAIDVTNPLQILVYYRNFQTVIFLDRTLTFNAKVELWPLGIPSIPTVAMASDGNLWLYNEISRTIQKISPDGILLTQSPDLTLLDNTTPRPVEIVERDNLVFMQTEEGSIRIFDNFGGFIRRISLKMPLLTGIHQIHRTMTLSDEENLYLFHPNDPLQEIRTISLPDGPTPPRFVAAWQDRLYIVRNEKIECYRFAPDQ